MLSANNQAEAKWGFLKNIVNIDTFFSSGSEDKPSPKKKDTKKKGGLF